MSAHPQRTARARAMTALLREVRACTICAAHLPLGPRPVLRASTTARLLIVGQAPGTRVHATGIPWNDPSGDRLRQWLALDREAFYDADRIAIVPMGFCYPGKGASGDLPPRPECAPAWHPRLLALMPAIERVLLVGRHAQVRYLGQERARSLTDTVRAWTDHGSRFIPLPHPSPRNIGWLRRNPWFDAEVVPALQQQVRAMLG